MDEERVQKVRSILPAGMGAGVAAVLVLLIGRAVDLTPFEATRPAAERLRTSQSNPLMIDARLWEDPLRAVARHREVESAEVPEELERLLGVVAPAAGTSPRRGGAVAVIAVALDGNSTSEATESRLRTRVAVNSALAQRGLIPEGDGGLYVAATERRKPRPGTAGSEDDDVRLQPTLAYELFRFDPFGEGARHPFEDTPTKLGGALVVWIDESSIAGDEHSGTVANLADRLARLLAPTSVSAADLSSLRFIAIAPVTSQLLSNVAEDLADELDGRAARAAVSPVEGLIQTADAYLATPLTHEERRQIEDEAGRRGLRDPERPLIAGPRAGLGTPPPRSEKLSEEKSALAATKGPAAAEAASEDRVKHDLELAVSVLSPIDRAAAGEDWRPIVAQKWLLDEYDVIKSRALKRDIEARIQVFSSRATTPLALARLSDVAADVGSDVERNARVGSPESGLRPGLSMAPRRLTPAVLSDQELAASLVDELGRRGLGLIGSPGLAPTDHLVLVSEWDTLYGRSLPFVFEVELTRRRLGDDSRYEDLYDQRLTNRIHAPSNVHRFTYLRGLDGEVPKTIDEDGDAGAGNAGKASSASEEREARLRQLERAEGPRQLDMIRRVGDRIARLDRQLRLEEQGRVAAIGILGSDFHDKLMVLQALRPQFSDAIFFTTDLDARLLQPRWYGLARNLVVASSYGLELAPQLQCQTPPFRDSYATATFAAVLAGLQRIDPRLLDAHAERRPDACLPVTVAHLQRLRPLLFEIGRNGAVELAPVDDRMETHPAVFDPRPRARRLALLGFPLLLGLFWWLSAPLASLLAGPSPPRAVRFRHWRWGITITAVAVAFASWRLMLGDALGGGEPLFWLQGVSAWPSELVWMLATLLSVLLLARAIATLQNDRGRVVSYFVDDDAPGGHGDRAAERAKRRWLSWLGEGWHNLGLRQWTCGSAEASEVWESYCEAGRLRWRFARVAVSVVGVSALMGLLAYTFGTPRLPVRSETARAFHWVWSVLGTLALTTLALFVFDAIRLCVCFVDALTKGGRARFPETARTKKEAEELGISTVEAGDLLTLRLLAERTETVGRLLLYPFAMTTLFVAARSGMFDTWTWSRAVTGLVVVILFVLLISGMHLQRSARRARWRVLRRIEERRLRLLGIHPPLSSGEATEPQLAAMREQVRSLDRGAFASWQANPVVGALMLPFGGAGAAWLVDVLLQLAR